MTKDIHDSIEQSELTEDEKAKIQDLVNKNFEELKKALKDPTYLSPLLKD